MFKVNFKNLISENNKFSYFLIFLLVQSFTFAGAYVSCGNPSSPNCEDSEYCADEMELHEVRCCSDDVLVNYDQYNGCDVWAESEFSSIGEGSDGCVSEVTFAEAEAVCAGEGARLCTQEEFYWGCTAGSGCAHDSDMIWTSDECSIPGHGCMEEDACNYDPNATFDNGSCLYQDCAGECGGNAVEDECGVCNGDGIAEGTCDCDGNVEDCAGVCGGTSVVGGCDEVCGSEEVVDECGVCGGPDYICSDPTACNEFNGTQCDECWYAEPNYDCDGNCIVDIDCAGECGGSSVEDECGVCNGNSNPQDCNNDGIDDVCEEGNSIAFDTGFFEGQSTGDVNHSGDVNVTDIIQIIEMILSND